MLAAGFLGLVALVHAMLLGLPKGSKLALPASSYPVPVLIALSTLAAGFLLVALVHANFAVVVAAMDLLLKTSSEQLLFLVQRGTDRRTIQEEFAQALLTVLMQVWSSAF